MDKNQFANYESNAPWIHHKIIKKITQENTNAHTFEKLMNTQSSVINSDNHFVVNNVPGTSNYLTTHNSETNNEMNNDQIAAENLMFMAHDGQMLDTDIITNENGTLVVAANDGTPINYEAIMQQIDLMVQHEDSTTSSIIYDNSDPVEPFIDKTPQMVMEEIVTDDWVQHQGEDRVVIPVDQIIGSGSHTLLDMEVPLHTVQDEYSTLRPYPCDFCSRRFRKKVTLMSHMEAHQNDRPHLCKLCNARFSRRQDLIIHLKAHAENELPLDDNNFLDFDKSANSSPTIQRGSTNDNDYDGHNWNMSSEYVPTCINNSSKINRDNTVVTTTITEVNFNFTSITSQTAMKVNELIHDYETSTTNTSGSQISHLTPKEDIYYNVVNADSNTGCNENVNDNKTDEINYVNNVVDERGSEKYKPKSSTIMKRYKPFVCQECGLAFAREKAFISHRKNHRQEESYECSQCHELFWNNESLQQHLKIHEFDDSVSEYDPTNSDRDMDYDDVNDDHDDNNESENKKYTRHSNTTTSDQNLYGDFYCNTCGISFHRLDRLKTHAKIHRSKNKNKAYMMDKYYSNSNINNQDQHLCCNTCGETFAEALDLLAHAEIHARYPSFKCVLCGETFIEESTIKRHLQGQHRNEITENSCMLCGKQCRDRKALIKHAWDHSLQKCHPCTKCGKKFHNKARLKRHWASHRDKSVQCEICHEEFPDGRTLSNHRHSHSTTLNGKLFPCNYCGKTFGSRSSQQIHLRIHTGEKPYGCRFCWKAFADGGTLRKHERIHTGEKPYVCSVCPRAFNQRVVLREHVRSHHSGLDDSRGTYYCRVCSAEMSTSRDLIQHLIDHSDMNTAEKRQPVTGPRKYKRRRKLKPHELARLENEGKVLLDFGSISDSDMTDIDDTFDLKESLASTDKDNNNMLNDNYKKNIPNNNKRHEYETKEEEQDDYLKVDVDIIKCGNSNDRTKKSSTIDKMKINEKPILRRYKEKDRHNRTNVNNSKSGRAKMVQQLNKVPMKSNNSSNTTRGRRRKTRNTIKENKMNIKCNKSMSDKKNANNEKPNKTLKCKKTNRTSLIFKTATIVDDFDIISPELQPPKQISCSPLHIKEEECYGFDSQLQCHYQKSQLLLEQQERETMQQKYKFNINNQNLQNLRPVHTITTAHDLYDAHLLLEASGLRQDYDDMLHSPVKTGKDGRRHRFTSESSVSTQFMADQSEEGQHLIKIEPTSPDLREIVNGIVNTNNNNNCNNNINNPNYTNNIINNCRGEMKLLACDTKRMCNTYDRKMKKPMQKEEHLIKKSQRGRSITSRSKCLTDANKANNIDIKHMTAGTFNNNNNSKNNLNNSTTSMQNTIFTSSSSVNASNLDYRTRYMKSSPIPSDTDNNSNCFAPTNTLVSDAKANCSVTIVTTLKQQQNEQQQQQQNFENPNINKRQRYFKCEMCSMIFSDRALLLDHVPIHI